MQYSGRERERERLNGLMEEEEERGNTGTASLGGASDPFWRARPVP